MTTPRDPGGSIRRGQTPRGGAGAGGPSPDGGGGGTGDERWTPEDRYVTEREPRFPRRDSAETWEPPSRRGRPVWASAALAALLGAILVALVVVAAVVLPGLASPDPSSPPSASPSGTLVAESPSPSAPPTTPSPTATAAATPQPSVLEVEVQPGDSLNAIADRHDTDPRSIAFWNRDRYPSLDPQSPDYEPDQIQVGWKLVVYPGQTFAEPSATAGPSGAGGSAAVPSPSASAAP